MSEIQAQDGFLNSAVVSFRSDLPKGGARRFRLKRVPGQKSATPTTSNTGLLPAVGGVAVLASDKLRIKVPAGERFFQKPKLLAEVPAPILSMARGEMPNDWCLAGTLRTESSLRVVALNTKLLESGPLFAKYRIEYVFEKGLQYVVALTLRHDERYVTIDEAFGGLQPHHETYLRLSLNNGLDPDQRSVMSNGGYHAQGYNGAFDKNTGANGRLPFELGLNRPNSMGVMRAASFYRETGPHALLVALYRLRDWKTVYRQVWYGNSGPGNLNFFARGKEKFLETRLEGGRRHWAIALIPRTEQEHVRITPGNKGRGPAGGPEVRLWQKLGDLSLNQFKDWAFEWEESLPARLFPKGRKVTYEQWLKAYGMNAAWWFLNAIVNYHWDFSAEVGPPSYGLMPGFFGDYERSRADWTPEQRAHVRSILLFLAYTAEDDNNLPHHSMLARQPNFVMQVKQTMAIACGVFPHHPHAGQWRDSFEKFYEEWLAAYGRSADSAHNALGGRWTENIACYSGTSLQALLRCARGLEILDGTDLLDHPMLRAWVKWYLHSFMSPHEGQRRVPPEGAHANAFAVGKDYWKDLFEIARRLKSTAPQLSSNMRWIETGGREGKRPSLKSLLIRDYGPVMRHDFGGPNEAYLHMMQTAGRYNYRWGPGNGILYYGAKNCNWSYNDSEANGDSFDVDRVTAFSVDGQGLGPHASDQPLFDFGFAQFYRAVADPIRAKRTGYLSRGILLSGDKFILVHDDVENQAEGRFVWVNSGSLPKFVQLKPGEKPDPTSTKTIRRYQGRGDFLTLVAPEEVAADPTPYGARIRETEHAFWSDRLFRHSEKGFEFEGRAGYARSGKIALFEGTRLRFGEMAIARKGGAFGCSAEIDGRSVKGRFAGSKGGRIFITLPFAFDSELVRVKVNDKHVRAACMDDTISFPVFISLSEGVGKYRVQVEP